MKKTIKRLWSLLLAACMVFSVLPAGTAFAAEAEKTLALEQDPSAIPTNIVLNKPITGTNTYTHTAAGVPTNDYLADKAVDGDSTTRWGAQVAYTESILTVDLEGYYQMDSFKITQFQQSSDGIASRINSFAIEVYDGESWTEIYSGTGSATTISGTFDETVYGQEIRLVMKKDAKISPSIYEFEVYGVLHEHSYNEEDKCACGAKLDAAQAVTEKINAIGEVTLESEETIKAARAAYDLLTEDQKALVTNIATLEAAEAALAELKKEMAVSISSLERNGKAVTVTGTSVNLGAKKVEIIVDADLDQRYVAQTLDDDGNWKCEFELEFNGDYEIEASIRDYSDFSKIIQTVPENNYYELDGRVIWGTTIAQGPDGLYYMIFSTWHNTQGFTYDWPIYSELGYATSTSPDGPFVYQGMALDASYSNTTNGSPVYWDGVGNLEVFSNPTMIHSEKDGKYYLYFMGTNATEGNYTYSYGRNHQRIGVAYADTPAGPWTVAEKPLIDVREGMYDSLLVSNPSVTEVKNEDGTYTYYTVYKAVSNLSGSDVVVSGCGKSDSPLGPFERSDEAIMRNPTDGWSVEDCFVWSNEGKLYALAKDFKSYFTGVSGYAFSYALFESTDGYDWGVSEHPLAFVTEVPWETGAQQVTNLERAQLYLCDGIPFLLCAATTKNGGSPYSGNAPINVQIPLLGVMRCSDKETVTVEDLTEKTVDLSVLESAVEAGKVAQKNCFTTEDWGKLSNALRAAQIISEDASARQEDVNFYAAELQKALALEQDPSAIPTNIVLNKPITGTNTYTHTAAGVPTNDYLADKAVDGDSTTRWGAQVAYTESILTVDLEGYYQMDSFKITQFQQSSDGIASRINSFAIEVYDGESWTEIYSGTGSATTISGTFDETVYGQEIRLVMKKDAKISPSIYEFEVYGVLHEHSYNEENKCACGAKLNTAQTVTEKINAIGEVTLESEEKITEARTAYDALTEEAKALVNNYQTLLNAEIQYAALVSAKNVEDAKSATEAAQAAQAAAEKAANDAAAAQTKAEVAQAAAEKAANDAAAAQTKAEVAQAAAEAAKDDAVTAAEAAKTAAENAGKDATAAANAKTAAEAAQAKAEAARTAAETAKADAATAQAKAVEAQGKAEEAQAAAEAAAKAAEENNTAAAAEATEAAKQAAAAADEYAKAAEEALKSATSASASAQSASESASYAAAAAQAAKDAQVAQKAAEEAAKRAEADKKTAEEAQKAAEAAQAAAEEAVLRCAKYQAALEMDVVAEQIDQTGYTADQIEAHAAAVSVAKEAIAAAETVEAVEKALAEGKAAIGAVEEMKPVIPFVDIEEDMFCYDAVLWAVENKITTGKTETTFQPSGDCTRAQVVTFLWRAAGEPEPKSSENPFPDVADGKYYTKAVLWAVEEGITNGFKDGSFGPDKTCTRGQIVTFLWRYAGEPEAKEETAFPDVDLTSYCGDAVLWAVEEGITTGYKNGTFGPDKTCKRDQIVTFLYRYLAE